MQELNEVAKLNHCFIRDFGSGLECCGVGLE